MKILVPLSPLNQSITIMLLEKDSYVVMTFKYLIIEEKGYLVLIPGIILMNGF